MSMRRHVSAGLAAWVVVSCGSPSAPELSELIVGHCAYQGPNSNLPECKDYLGAWTYAASEKDCLSLKGTFEGGTVCQPAQSLGACLFGSKPEQNRTYIVSDNTQKCAGAKTGCELFGGGFWKASALCSGVSDELVVLENAFREPQQVCRDDAAGQVCVWESIHGATSVGRSFREDAQCDNSRSGRPYYPKDADACFGLPDERRSDPGYLAEEAWVKSQINSTSCVCCHSAAAPNGASVFDIDREGSFANQLTDRGIAHGSGLVNSIPLGAFPAAMNNGFAKSDVEHPDYSIFLSTDPARMKRFFEKEIEHRKLSAADFEGVPDGFGPLSEQYYFKPQPCSGREGIAADGTVTWGNGRARRVYVMDAQAHAPTVFPNLDLPPGTQWRLDVPPSGSPLVSGSVKYGTVPEGLTQRFPKSGPPRSLVPGQQYFLYVSADQMLPITRCLITAQ
jgi:hypothetical protein